MKILTQPKIKPWRSKPYREWIASFPCEGKNCRERNPQIIRPHHQQAAKQGGTGTKPGDDRCLPLCYRCHTSEARIAAEKFKSDPEELIRWYNALWIAKGHKIGEE